VGSDRNELHSARKNLQSAVDHPQVIEDYLNNELSLGWISGPYTPSMCPDVHIIDLELYLRITSRINHGPFRRQCK